MKIFSFDWSNEKNFSLQKYNFDHFSWEVWWISQGSKLLIMKVPINSIIFLMIFLIHVLSAAIVDDDLESYDDLEIYDTR